MRAQLMHDRMSQPSPSSPVNREIAILSIISPGNDLLGDNLRPLSLGVSVTGQKLLRVIGCYQLQPSQRVSLRKGVPLALVPGLDETRKTGRRDKSLEVCARLYVLGARNGKTMLRCQGILLLLGSKGRLHRNRIQREDVVLLE